MIHHEMLVCVPCCSRPGAWVLGPKWGGGEPSSFSLKSLSSCLAMFLGEPEVNDIVGTAQVGR